METPAHGDLAYSLTQYFFGDNVASVIKILFNSDQISLKTLKSTNRGRKFEDLKRGLLILVKYQLVDYSKTVRNYNNQHYEYSVVPTRIFNFFSIPKYIHNLSLKEGQPEAIALSILYEKGLLSTTVWTQIISSKLMGMGNQKFDSDRISILTQKLVTRKFAVQIGENICLNIERLHRHYRDDLIIAAINKFYNEDAKVRAICKALLLLSFDNTDDEAPITAPVSFKSLENYMKNEAFEPKILDQYLSKLSTEKNFRFFLKSGRHENLGVMYALDIGSVIDYSLKEHLCSLITTRFGPKCCRVFRLLLQKGPLLLKQIEECIMLPARDVREYAYILIKEGFIRNRQVPKTPDNAPGKSIFIMFVEIDRVIYNLADLCCRTISNLLIRYNYELRRNEAILTRSRSVQELLKKEYQCSVTDPGSNLEIWTQYFNSHELAQLDQINKTLDKILYAKTQVDETLVLAHIWMRLRPNMEKDFSDN